MKKFVPLHAWLGICVLLGNAAEAGEIHDAVGRGDVAKVKSLLRADPSLANAPGDDYRKFPPILVATEARRTNMVDLLLALGADIHATNKDAETALYRAAMWGHKDMVEFLLSRKADVNFGDKFGRSPALSVAAINAHTEVVRVLLAHKARVDGTFVEYVQKMAADPILDKPEHAEKKKACQQTIEFLSKALATNPPNAAPTASTSGTPAQKVTFTLAETTVAVGEQPRVTFSEPLAAAAGERYWITLVEEGTPDSAWGQWQYVEAGAKEATLAAPTTEGKYEVRLHGNYPTKSYHVIHRASLSVTVQPK